MMNFIEALKYLKIEEYTERIFNSNSRGELSHLQDYIDLAEYCKKNSEDYDTENFKEMFVHMVNISNDDIFMQHFPNLIKTVIEIEVFSSLTIKKYLRKQKDKKTPDLTL